MTIVITKDHRIKQLVGTHVAYQKTVQLKCMSSCSPEAELDLLLVNGKYGLLSLITTIIVQSCHSAQPLGGDRSGRLLGTNPYGNAPIGATIQHNRNISIQTYISKGKL